MIGSITATLKMRKILVIPRLGFVYRMFIDEKPSNFLIAFRGIFRVWAFWFARRKRFPYFTTSKFFHYTKGEIN